MHDLQSWQNQAAGHKLRAGRPQSSHHISRAWHLRACWSPTFTVLLGFFWLKVYFMLAKGSQCHVIIEPAAVW